MGIDFRAMADLRIAILDSDSGFVRVLVKRAGDLGWRYRCLEAPPPVDEFVAMRTARDKTLGMPKLIIPSIQINIRGGKLPSELVRAPVVVDGARKGLLIVGIMTAHSFTEGVGLGVSFGSGTDLGLFITLAIAVHNIPEGLAISLVLVPRGVGAGRAAFWSVFSSLPQPLMAVPAFAFVEAFGPLLPYGLGFAAGAMTWKPRAPSGARGSSATSSRANRYGLPP